MAIRADKLSKQEQHDRLRLIRSENVGPATFWRLMTHYGNAAKALDALPELARRGGKKRPIKVCPVARIDDEIKQVEKLDGRFLHCGQTEYPKTLAAIDPPPPVLCVLGHTVLFSKRIVAIVGARNASAAGRRLSTDLAHDLGEADIVVASGLARGIDTAAHQGALATGTIAVMAGGVDSIYPPENAGLYKSIAQTGAVVSELPLGVTAQARDFPRRNRIISGLSLGVIVVEASLKSGSLITANYAADQGREVFAVPGSPLDPRAKGPNRLIRDGATLVENAHDVIQVLDGMQRSIFDEPKDDDLSIGPDQGGPHVTPDELDRARELVQSLLGPTPISIDELIRQSESYPAAVQVCLLELELAGRLERHPGQMVSLL